MPDANLLSLAGHVAIVTGAGRGIGAAVARLYSRAGAHLALLDKDAASVSRTDAGLNGRSHAMPALLTSASRWPPSSRATPTMASASSTT